MYIEKNKVIKNTEFNRLNNILEFKFSKIIIIKNIKIIPLSKDKIKINTSKFL